MEGSKNVGLALERTVRPRAAALDAEQKLNISVIFTSVEPTLRALRRASALASSLGARVTLLVPQVVPYPLPLHSPPVLLDWSERRFHVIAAASAVPTEVRIYLCRDQVETLESVLRPASIVVLGGRKRWWPTPETSLARRLRKSGHEVILADTE